METLQSIPLTPFLTDTLQRLRTNFSEKTVLVTVVSFGQPRGSAVLDSLYEHCSAQSRFKGYTLPRGVVTFNIPVVVEGRALLTLEVRGWEDAWMLAGLLLGSVLVVNLDAFNSVTHTEKLLTMWLRLKDFSRTEKVFLMMEETQAWRADCLIRRFAPSEAQYLREHSQILVYRDEVEAGLRLQTLLSALKFTYLRSANVVLREWEGFMEVCTEGRRRLAAQVGPTVSAKDSEALQHLETRLNSLFDSTTSSTASLFSVFSERAKELFPEISPSLQPHFPSLLRSFESKCELIERDLVYFQSKRLYDMTGELLLLASYPLARSAASIETRISTVIHHFPEAGDKLSKLQTTLISLNNSQKAQLEQSKLYLKLMAVSVAALAFALLSDNWVRMFLVSAGLCGLLSIVILRSTLAGKPPEVALCQAANFLQSQTQIALTPHVQRLFAMLSEEEPVTVALMVGVNNPAVWSLANAVARHTYPYALVQHPAFEGSQCAKILSVSFVSEGKVSKGLLVAINFQGRNDTQEYRFLLKLAIGLFGKSSKTVLLHSGSDSGKGSDVRQDSTLKNIVEMSLMGADEVYREYLLVTSDMTASCMEVKQSFESWHAAVSVVSDADLAGTLAAELPYLPRISKEEVARQVANALTGI